MDLLKELAQKINVTYNLTLSPDGQFGSYVTKNNSGNYSINVTILSGSQIFKNGF